MNVTLSLAQTSSVLEVPRRTLQRLIALGLLSPTRSGRAYTFEHATLMQARIALYLRDTFGMPLLAACELVGSSGSPDMSSPAPESACISARSRNGEVRGQVLVPFLELATKLTQRLQLVAQSPFPAPRYSAATESPSDARRRDRKVNTPKSLPGSFFQGSGKTKLAPAKRMPHPKSSQRLELRQHYEALCARVAALAHDLAHPIQNIGSSGKLIIRQPHNEEVRDLFKRTLEHELPKATRLLAELGACRHAP